MTPRGHLSGDFGMATGRNANGARPVRDRPPSGWVSCLPKRPFVARETRSASAVKIRSSAWLSPLASSFVRPKTCSASATAGRREAF